MRQLLLAFLLAFALPACRTQTPIRVAVVAVGTSVSVLHTEHQRVYRDATDALRARVRSRGGNLEEYDREVRPIDAAFRQRTDALIAVDAALYATAAIADAVNRGAPVLEYRSAARDILTALDRVVSVMGSQTALPGVTVPAEIRTAIGVLTAISNGVTP